MEGAAKHGTAHSAKSEHARTKRKLREATDLQTARTDRKRLVWRAQE